MSCSQVKCCGSYNASDWKDSKWYKGITAGLGANSSAARLLVPESCCKDRKSKCSQGADGGIQTLVSAKKIYNQVGNIYVSINFNKNSVSGLIQTGKSGRIVSFSG